MVALSLFTAFCLASLLSSQNAYAQAYERQNRLFSEGNADILLYFETIAKIREECLFVKPEKTRLDIVQDSIRAFLKTIDPVSTYLSPDQYRLFKASLSQNYVGIGMEIEKTEEGQIICFPYPSGPAESAGIRSGDVLISIDDKEIVRDASVMDVFTLMQGEKGTSVKLKIKNRNESGKIFTVKRRLFHLLSVSKKWISGLPVIQIRTFDPNTPDLLRLALNDLNPGEPTILDLRGNGGGDFHSAIDAAMLFLKEGQEIITVKTKQSTSDAYTSLSDEYRPDHPVFLFQDRQTASAAEVFIAALVKNGQARSVGKTTFGKGTKQDIIELSDGSALVLTTGLIYTPDGTAYDGKGLDPSIDIETDSPETSNYIKIINRLI